MNENRVAIFIDGSNLYHSLTNSCGRHDVDFHQFSLKLLDIVNAEEYVRTYYYNFLRKDPGSDKYKEEMGFINVLYNTPLMDIRFGSLNRSRRPIYEDTVDIIMTIDILDMAYKDQYDAAILVTGDGDFAYVANAVKEIGKHVIVAAFDENLSNLLSDIADDTIHFDDAFFNDVWRLESGKEQPE